MLQQRHSWVYTMSCSSFSYIFIFLISSKSLPPVLQSQPPYINLTYLHKADARFICMLKLWKWCCFTIFNFIFCCVYHLFSSALPHSQSCMVLCVLHCLYLLHETPWCIPPSIFTFNFSSGGTRATPGLQLHKCSLQRTSCNVSFITQWESLLGKQIQRKYWIPQKKKKQPGFRLRKHRIIYINLLDKLILLQYISSTYKNLQINFFSINVYIYVWFRSCLGS